ncbi:substrate-binding domain-containing protein [Fundicoccus sp. Sow4_D5]|uniref:substrate-binding domain-containing protein n=1 Tax=Fundicoccus sp. Sow4_D5 TaxID=3438782 RepID=UPI003F930C5F
MVTLNDIAKASGYSPATISRLFKNDPSLSIRPQSKKIIFDTAMQLGYPLEKINFAFDRVLLLYWISENEELQDEYFLEMHQQLDQFARNKHFSLTILRKGKLDPHYLRTYDAFIAVGSFSMLDLEILEKNFEYGVFVEAQHFQNKFDTVNPDLEYITKKAIRLFLDKGYRKIGFIGGSYFSPDHSVESRDIRESYFRHYLNSYNLLQEKYIFSGGKFSIESGRKLANEMLQSLEKDPLPEAILIASDTIALGVLQILEQHHVKIPEDLEIISINNKAPSQDNLLTLASFAIDIPEIARTAINLLYEQLTSHRKISKNVLIGSMLSEGDSFQA